MELYAVRSQIVEKKFDAFYVFTGDELEVMWQYIRAIAKKSEKPLRYVDSFADVYKKLTNSLIQTSACYVLRDDADLLSDEKLWERLGTHEKPVKTLLKDNIVILLVTSLDKRTKFYKHYKETVVEFNTLPNDLLIQYVQKIATLSERNCVKLIDACEASYGRILSEVDKIRHADGDDDNETFEQFIEDGTIYTPPEDAIFKLATVVLQRNARASFILLDECKRYGEATLVIISVLYNAVKQLMQVQSCKGDVAKVTGLTSWQIKQVSVGLNKYSISELLRFMKRLRDAERGIKNGTIEEKLAVEHVLCEVL